MLNIILTLIVAAGAALLFFPRLRCRIGWHREEPDETFTSQGVTIYGVVCARCGGARCHLNGFRPGLPWNDSYRAAREQAKAWLERKTGNPVCDPFIGPI